MAEAAKTQEPSMEELRARIRRIIAATDDKPAQAGGTEQQEEPLVGHDHVPSPSRVLDAASGAKEQEEPLLGHAGEHVPIPSRVLDAAPGGKERQEPAAEQAPMPSRVPYAPPDREGRGEPHFGHAGQQLAMSSHGPQSAPAPDGGDWDQLISPEANNAVHSAFNTLAQTVLVHNARTLEDMVREMLRPMLKVWIDNNLPTIVERLVRAEIERAQRPARGKPGER